MTSGKLMRLGFRVAVLVGVCVVGFYLGRPLYWKLSATLQDIREKDYTQEAVKKGLSDLVAEAQRSVGWGPVATIKFEQERALLKAQEQSQQIESPNNSSDTETDLLSPKESTEDLGPSIDIADSNVTITNAATGRRFLRSCSKSREDH